MLGLSAVKSPPVIVKSIPVPSFISNKPSLAVVSVQGIFTTKSPSASGITAYVLLDVVVIVSVVIDLSVSSIRFALNVVPVNTNPTPAEYVVSLSSKSAVRSTNDPVLPIVILFVVDVGAVTAILST